MKGKISTKAIVITILTVLLLGVAATGTVLFLKDNGEAAAKTEEQNTEAILPVTGDETENQQIENGQEQATTPDVNSNGAEAIENVEGTNAQENAQTSTGTSTTTTTPSQTTRTITEEPETTTVEVERVASETTTLGWSNISRNFAEDEDSFEGKEINYADRIVTASVKEGKGTATPEEQSVTYGEDAETIVIAPGGNEAIKEIKVNGVVLSNEERDALKRENNKIADYTFTQVKENKTLEVTFGEDKNNNGTPDDEEYRTITYTDGVDGEEVFADQVYDKALDGLATPAYVGSLDHVRTDYVFAGWNPEVAATVEGNQVYTATWKDDKNNNGTPDDEEYRTITYTDGVDGEEVFADQVYDKALDGLATPAYVGSLDHVRIDYVFTGWNPSVKATVEGDQVYTATWKDDKNNNGVPDEDETYSYSVEYYYDGVKDETKTMGGTALAGTIISAYVDKNIPGYKLEKNVEPIEIKESDNILKVYYVKDSYTYTIEYYKDSLNSTKIATKGGTDSYKKEYKTQLTNEIVTADAGLNWINEFKPDGYNNGTVTYTTIEIENNVVKVLYTPNEQLNYTIKYYFNNSIDEAKTQTGTGAYGTSITAADYTSEGWELDTTKTNTLNFILNSDTNVFDVYYVKPIINVVKTSDVSGKDVKYGDVITYTITATNTGDIEGTVTVKDSDLQTLINENKVQVNAEYFDIANELMNGKQITVQKNSNFVIRFKVTVTANAGQTIKNTLDVTDGTNNQETEVISSVEKTVTIREKSFKKQHIIIIMDTTESVRNHVNTEIEAVCNFINGMNSANTDFTVVRYSWSTASIVGSTKHISKNALIDKIERLSWGDSSLGGTIGGATDLEDALEWPDDYTDENEEKIVIFMGDGMDTETNTATNIWPTYHRDARISRINNTAANLRRQANAVYTIGIDMIKETSIIYSQREIDRANDLMKNIIPSSPGNFYESTYDATSSNNIQNTLQTLLTRLKNERTVTSSNGKVLLDNIDATKGIIINDVEYTTLPSDKIINTNGEYYLELSSFEASEDITIEYVVK